MARLLLPDFSLGQSWVPPVDRVLDQSKVVSSYTIPTSAISLATAVAVPGLTITPLCPPGPLRLKAWLVLTHGAAGWVSGMGAVAFIGDATLSATTPILTGAWAVTQNNVSNFTFQGLIETEYAIAAADAGTRTFSVYVYLTNVALTAAQLQGATNQESWLKAEIGA